MGNIDKFLNPLGIKPEVLGIGFHEGYLADEESILCFFGLKEVTGKLLGGKVVEFLTGEDIDIGPPPEFRKVSGNGAGLD
jgi:hypothetical protein